MSALINAFNEQFLLEIIKQPDSTQAAEIIKQADQVRTQTLGATVQLRGLIEFSSYCRNNCAYCGLRRENRSLPRYRLTPIEIIETAAHGIALGYRTIVLQSGEDLFFTGKMLTEIVKEIKKLGAVVTLSVGEREVKDYEAWRKAGAERYLMRHETADPILYQKLHQGQTLSKRIALLYALKQLDYQVGTGFMVGLPGQTPATLLADLQLTKNLAAEMVGIGPFIPHLATPLKEYPAGTTSLTCLMIALTRLALPYALIPATTALASINSQGRELGLAAGANVVMPNLTPWKYRADYQLYPDKAISGAEDGETRQKMIEKITALGREVSDTSGHHPLWLTRQQGW